MNNRNVFEKINRRLMALFILGSLFEAESYLSAIAHENAAPRSSTESSPKRVSFHIVLDSIVDLETAQSGDDVQAHLTAPLDLDKGVTAPAKSILLGYVKVLSIEAKNGKGNANRHYSRDKRNIKIVFKKIVTPTGSHLCIKGSLAEQDQVFNNNGTFKKVRVSASGVIESARVVLQAAVKDDISDGAEGSGRPPEGSGGSGSAGFHVPPGAADGPPGAGSDGSAGLPPAINEAPPSGFRGVSGRRRSFFLARRKRRWRTRSPWNRWRYRQWCT